MSSALRFLPGVEGDVLAAYGWYEGRSLGLGEDFLRTFYAGAYEIPRHPLLYREVHREFRRRLLSRFPYAIYFSIQAKEIVVFGVFHCARDPYSIGMDLEQRAE